MTHPAPKVVVFGSLHYDIMVEGPGRPRKGETVTGTAWYPKCGGKGGNQAVSAAKTGIATDMIGAVADDTFGQALVENLARHGVGHRFVRHVDGVGSGMSVAITDSDGDYGAVIVSGANLALGDADVAAASSLFDSSAVLVLQNEVPDAANVAAARAAKSAGGRVILNAAPARPLSDDLAGLIDILVVNAIEAEEIAAVPVVDTLDGAKAAARILARRFPVAVVTAGGDGVACAAADGAEIALAAIPVTVVSTHGAGDEFVGVLASELARGRSLAVALGAANRAAAFLVSGGNLGAS
jgi:ribokinase